MAALHATMENSRGNEVSTTNSKVARTMVETYEVCIVTVLLPDGKYTIRISDRSTDVTIHEYTGQYPQPNNSTESE